MASTAARAALVAITATDSSTLREAIVGLEDELVACCCSGETKAFFGPWLGSPLSVHWRRKLSVSLLPPLIEIDYCG